MSSAATLKQNKNITVIPELKVIQKDLKLETFKPKLKVAGYARVSTDLDEQQSSFEAQVDYYTKFISKNDDWDFVGLYSDEGISGTQAKIRPGFTKMINDALAGKIDLILTKSVSRFARNTVDALETVRKLKEKNVEVYFEKENIKTLDSKGELFLTILSSLAQEESRSISENCKWGQRKRFSDGKYSVAYSRFLGYDKNFKINEDEAKAVRLIFKLFLSGSKYSEIASELELKGIKTACGKDKWRCEVIKDLLTNEKYCGNALLQKSYTADFISKKHLKNNGEVKQYFIEEGHEAIISKEEFELAQIEVKRREEERLQNRDVFSGKLVCAECGKKYYKCTMTSKDKKSKYIAYKCDGKNKPIAKGGCDSQYINIEIVKSQFIKEFNEILKNDKERSKNIIESALRLLDTKMYEDKITEFANKLKHIEKSEYSDIYHKKLNEEIKKSKDLIEHNNLVKKSITNIKNSITEFDDILFKVLINYVLIDKNKNIILVWN